MSAIPSLLTKSQVCLIHSLNPSHTYAPSLFLLPLLLQLYPLESIQCFAIGELPPSNGVECPSYVERLQ